MIDWFLIRGNVQCIKQPRRSGQFIWRFDYKWLHIIHIINVQVILKISGNWSKRDQRQTDSISEWCKFWRSLTAVYVGFTYDFDQKEDQPFWI